MPGPLWACCFRGASAPPSDPLTAGPDGSSKAEARCGVGESGRPRVAHNHEITGSNPVRATTSPAWIAKSLPTAILAPRSPNWSGTRLLTGRSRKRACRFESYSWSQSRSDLLRAGEWSRRGLQNHVSVWCKQHDTAPTRVSVGASPTTDAIFTASKCYD